MQFRIVFFSCLSLLLLPFFLEAQIGGRLNNLTRGGSGASSPQNANHVDPPDTLDFSYFYSDNPGLEYSYRDTSIDAGIWQYDPIRRQEYDYTHLGNLGSAHQPIVYQPMLRKGFDLGFHQFDLYKLKREDLPFYRLKQAFTNAYFSQGTLQTDAYFKAQFSRNFGKTLNYTLDYKRINNGGAYANQRATNTAFGTGFWYHGPKNRYDSFISYRTNAIAQEDNGGIRTDQLNDNNRNNEFSIPTFLTTARTRHDQRAFAYTHYFRIGGKKAPAPVPNNQTIPPFSPDYLNQNFIPQDSLGLKNDSIKLKADTANLLVIDSSIIKTDSLSLSQLDSTFVNPRPRPRPPAFNPPVEEVEEGRAFLLAHTIQFERGIFKFYDDNLASDSLYYKHLQVDQRGLRNSLEHRTLENEFKISTSSRREGKTNKQSTGSQRDLLEVGLHHTLHWIKQEPRDSNINNLFLTGKWNFTPSDRLLVQTYAHFGLLDNRGDYTLNGNFYFDLKNAGSLRLRGISQLAEPSLIQNRIYISQRQLWNNNFKKQLDNSLSASYYQPITQTEISGQIHLVSNYIYYDTLAFPKQDNGTIRVLQLMLNQKFKLWKFHFDSWAMLQDISGDKLRLPGFYYKQSMYFKGKVFKGVLDTKIGLNLRLNDRYFANNYQPLTGQFHLQDDQIIDYYPAVDLFIAFKVKYFRGFFRMENITNWVSDDFFYQTANYPYPFAAIRFGLNWQLIN